MIQSREDDIPDYINAKLIETALRAESKNNEIQITELKLMMGCEKGENLGSEIYRAVVTYKNNVSTDLKRSLIVKAVPFYEYRGPIHDFLEVYEKEYKLYNEIIPKLSKIADNEIFSAKFFYATKDPVKIIIMEDLISLGYKLVPRQIGADLDHCKLLVEKIAKFHIASMILQENEPHLFSNNYFHYGIFSPGKLKPDDVVNNLFCDGLKELITAVRKWTGYEEILKKLINIDEGGLIHRTHEHLFRDNYNIKVLNHGDLRLSNFLFKYNNNNKPIDVIFIDFQICVLNSFGWDLNYFLYTSLKNDVRQQNIDDIVKRYHQTFGESLRKYSKDDKKSIPSLNEIKMEVSNLSFFGFVTSVGILPLCLLDIESSDNNDVDSLISKDRSSLITNPLYQEAMEYILKMLDESHVLDNDYYPLKRLNPISKIM